MINAQFHKVDIPSGKDVCRKQFFHFMEKLMLTDVSHGDYETYLPDLMEKFADVSKEEVLQRVAALEFNHFLKYYENAEDLNRSDFGRDRKNVRDNIRSDFKPRECGGRDRRGSSNRNSGYTRLFINLGTKDGFYKASFLQFILDMSDLSKDVLGKIDIALNLHELAGDDMLNESLYDFKPALKLTEFTFNYCHCISTYVFGGVYIVWP
jgi:ATP-dependent RNA helicase DeaD